MNSIIAESPAEKICRKCQTRFTYRDCPACKKISSAKYRAANIEKIRAAGIIFNASGKRKPTVYVRAQKPPKSEEAKAAEAELKAKNRERKKAVRAAYRLKNKEKAYRASAKWRAEHPENRRRYSLNRRARKMQASGKISDGLAKKLFKLQRGKCACCAMPLGEKYHMDHIMPLALGGSNDDSNIQLLRPVCNMQKSVKHPVDFMQQRGFLL